MNKSDILKNLKPIISKLRQEYFYIDYKIFSKLFEQVLSDNQNNISKLNIPLYEQILKQQMDILVEKHIIDSVNRKDYTVIYNYINHLNYSEDYENNALSIQQISIFLEKYGIYLDITEYCKILDKSFILSKIIQNIFYHDFEQIKNNQLIEVYENDYMINFMSAYLSKYNISYSKHTSNQVEDDNFKLYLNSINNYPLLTREEEQKYFELIKQGDLKAREYIINCNQRLIISLAKHYVNKGVDILDLCQEANLDLMEAINRFDISKGYKFSTYATHWIKRALRNSTRVVSFIRIPYNYQTQIIKYRNGTKRYIDKYGKEPNDQELAEYMNEPLANILKYKDIESNIIATASLNTIIDLEDHHDTELVEFLKDDNINIEKDFEQDDLKKQLTNLLNNSDLNEREKNVILLHIAYKDQITRLEEIGKQYGVCRERIRQIEERGLSKIRFNPQTESLTEYLDNPERGKRLLKDFKKTHKKPRK